MLGRWGYIARSIAVVSTQWSPRLTERSERKSDSWIDPWHFILKRTSENVKDPIRRRLRLQLMSFYSVSCLLIGYGKMQEIGKTIIIFGVILISIGLLLTFFHKIPFLGKLPGDIYIQKRKFAFYFPITTSLLISTVLSLILSLWSRR